MFRSLWFKLSVAFTVIAMITIVSLCFVVILFSDWMDFEEYVTPDHLAEIVGENQYLFAEAIKAAEQEKWRAKAGWLEMAKKQMYDETTNISTEDGIFQLNDACVPGLYYRVYDMAGALFFSYPESFPPEIEEFFESRGDSHSEWADRVADPELGEMIWIRREVTDNEEQWLGRIDFLLDANFSFWVLLKRMTSGFLEEWYTVVIFFSLIGLTCGIVANCLVTGQLKRMNTVTSIWSGGNLSPRIPVNAKSKDILADHSRTLNGMADELETLVALRQQAAVTDERNRVARELHDTVKQNLFALKLQLATIRRKNPSDAIAPYLAEAQHITHEAQQDIMHILVQLAPATSGKIDFYGRLAALAEDMRRRYTIQVDWERREPVFVKPKEEQTLLRIAQESMSNAVRHGGATTLVMEAFRKDGMNHWRMTDNGCGLPGDWDEGRKGGVGMGINFMRERAGELPEGELHIGNAPDGGVTVHVAWRAE